MSAHTERAVALGDSALKDSALKDSARRLEEIRAAIGADESNATYTRAGILPLFAASPRSRIVIIGQAPGKRAEASGVPWDDASGVTLRDWMGLTETQFYDPDVVALIPMDFYYPGKGTSGDLPPRKAFAPTWHPRILAELGELRLTVLIGGYAQKYYLGPRAKPNLTLTVRAWAEYQPGIIPLVHPSPLNFRWQAKNPWFATEVVPALQAAVSAAVD